MTDEKLNECGYYDPYLCNGDCIIQGLGTNDSILYCWCKDNPNCYYKQLQRKEQECEELKERLERADEDLKHQCIECMNIKSDQYKQALEKIEEIASKNIDSPNLECIYKEGPCTFPKCKDEFTQNGETCIVRGREEILNIINKVKDD